MGCKPSMLIADDAGDVTEEDAKAFVEKFYAGCSTYKLKYS